MPVETELPPGEAARRGDEVQRRRYDSMTPEEKIRIQARLYWSARQLKEASLRSSNPQLTDAEIRRRVNEWLLYARD